MGTACMRCQGPTRVRKATANGRQRAAMMSENPSRLRGTFMQGVGQCVCRVRQPPTLGQQPAVGVRSAGRVRKIPHRTGDRGDDRRGLIKRAHTRRVTEATMTNTERKKRSCAVA